MVLAISAPVFTDICVALTATEPALPLAVEVAEAIIPLPESLKLSGPCAVNCTVPPFPAPAELEATSAPLETVIAPPAVNTISPAGPLEPGAAEAVIRLAPLGPWPESVTPSATVTVTAPPLPGPAVELAICAPPSMPRLPARIVTEPPGPDRGPMAEAAIWVLATPALSSTSAPDVVTLTEPPEPVPAVVLAI